jgi:hypothetical protein
LVELDVNPGNFNSTEYLESAHNNCENIPKSNAPSVSTSPTTKNPTYLNAPSIVVYNNTSSGDHNKTVMPQRVNQADAHRQYYIIIGICAAIGAILFGMVGFMIYRRSKSNGTYTAIPTSMPNTIENTSSALT